MKEKSAPEETCSFTKDEVISGDRNYCLPLQGLKALQRKVALLSDSTRCFFESLSFGGGLFTLTGEGMVILSSFLTAAQGYLSSIPVKISQKITTEQSSLEAYNSLEPYEIITQEKMHAISKSGWRGEPLWCGAGLFEDNHLMAYEVQKSDGSYKLKVAGKITSSKDAFIQDRFKTSGALYEEGVFAVPVTKLSKGKLVEGGFLEQTGKIFTLSLPSDITVRYRPYEKAYSYKHNELVNSLTLQGDIEIEAPGGVSIKEILSIFGKALGTDIKEPSKGEMEILYLQKNIQALKLDTPEYKNTFKRMKDTSLETQIAYLLTYIRTNTGFFPRSLPDYNWKPLQDKPSNISQGKPYWIRFDAKEHIQSNLVKYVLVHNNYSKDEVKAILDIFSSTATLLPTKERKLSLGISNRGITSDRDMDVGAANYTFFHLSKSPEKGTIVLSNNLLKRTDTVIYGVGKFGRIGEEDFPARVSLDRAHKTPVYEVMVKDGVYLPEYIGGINVSSEENKIRLIRGLHDLGFKTLNNLPVEEWIFVKK